MKLLFRQNGLILISGYAQAMKLLGICCEMASVDQFRLETMPSLLRLFGERGAECIIRPEDGLGCKTGLLLRNLN